MIKLRPTNVERYSSGSKVPLNLTLYMDRGRHISRSPFFGIPLTSAEKTAAVHNGAPDGRSGWPITRVNDTGRLP